MIYAKNINQAQRKALQQYEDISGFEPMHQDELDDKTMSFREAWNSNIQFLENVLADVTNIRTDGCG